MTRPEFRRAIENRLAQISAEIAEREERRQLLLEMLHGLRDDEKRTKTCDSRVVTSRGFDRMRGRVRRAAAGRNRS